MTPGIFLFLLCPELRHALLQGRCGVETREEGVLKSHVHLLVGC